MEKNPIVGVMGSGVEPHEDLAAALGSWLAQQGVHLLTGGGRGVMSSVSRAFVETPNRAGLSIGVLPCASEREPHRGVDGYPNPWIEIPIQTHLPYSGTRGTRLESRNHINVLSSAAIVVLPGGAGTRSEIELAITYEKPVISYHDGVHVMELPAGVPATSSFDEVTSFVLRHLRA